MRKLLLNLLASGVFISFVFSPEAGEEIDYRTPPNRKTSPGDAAAEDTLFQSRYPDGQLKMKGLIKEGVRHGVWTFWRADGSREKVEEYDQGVRDGTWIWFGPDGKELARSDFIRGTGRDFDFYRSGARAWEGSYKRGRKEGRWIFWYPDGRRRLEGFYRAGRKDGMFTYWRSNGVKLMEGEFKGGLMEDTWTMWFSNGIKMSEENYRSGEKDGPARYWSAYDGRQTREDIYREGRLISSKKFPAAEGADRDTGGEGKPR